MFFWKILFEIIEKVNTTSLRSKMAEDTRTSASTEDRISCHTVASEIIICYYVSISPEFIKVQPS